MWANRGPAFEISLSRLHRIETTKVIPGIHGLYALAVITQSMNSYLSTGLM